MNPKEIEILMVLETDTATSQLIERILFACHPHGIRYRKQFLHHLDEHDIRPYTIPLFVRCVEPLLSFWISCLKKANHPYIYYIDDNFWKIEGHTSLARYFQNPVIRNSLNKGVTEASLVLTNSPELATFIEPLNAKTRVLPAFFDFSLIEGCHPKPTEEVRIGFAGSPCRGEDLEIIRSLLDPLLEQFPHLVFEFAGVMPKDLQTSPNVRFFPYTFDYKAFVQFQIERNWAIGLAPLIDTEAKRSKTNNKYREYGASKIAGIYSNLPLYQRSVTHGETGLLVPNTSKAWYEAICELILHPEKRRKIALKAYEDVRQKHCVQAVSEVWAHSFKEVQEIIACNAPCPLAQNQFSLKIKRLTYTIHLVYIKIKGAFCEGGLRNVIKKSLKKVLNQSIR